MIRSELDVLLDKVQDPALRADLRVQIDRLKQRRSFGLVFEQHIPERVRLPQHPIRVGAQVVSRDDDDSPTFEVVAIDDDGVATLVRVREPDGTYVQRSEHGVGAPERAPVESLVVMTDFGEPVLPGLRHLGSVERGGDKPYHVVIKGENHHALEMLRFTHAGKIDCIYIDPPYNSGARDWKYNNDYVDANDAYRHSKWLAFMERRLKLAKELLREDGVLIVTIDENEVHRTGLVLEQIFCGARIQMVTIAINPSGTSGEGFSRVEEYAFFLFHGGTQPNRTLDDFFGPEEKSRAHWWHHFIRGDSNWPRLGGWCQTGVLNAWREGADAEARVPELVSWAGTHPRALISVLRPSLTLESWLPPRFRLIGTARAPRAGRGSPLRRGARSRRRP